MTYVMVISNQIREMLGRASFGLNGFRVTIILSACLFAYYGLLGLGSIFGFNSPEFRLFSWFAACLAVAAFDQLVLSLPLKNFRKTFALENKGKFEEAHLVLSSLNSKLVACPKHLIERRKIALLVSEGRLEEAEELLNRTSSLKENDRTRLRALSLAKSNVEEALNLLEDTKNAVLGLEKAFLVKHSGARPYEVKSAFQEVLDLPMEPHPSGESTHVLASAWLEATRLWTGHAEEAIVELGAWINRIRRASVNLPSLRPYLAELYSERAFYHSTHREPFLALNDLSIAKALSKKPRLLERYNEIETILKDRHGLDSSPAVGIGLSVEA